MSNYLQDKEFLKKLDSWPQREVYAKVISLSYAENPVAEITGNVTQGSINLDGSSAVRRTCSLTLVTTSVNVNEMDWALKTKFRLEIGLKNFFDKRYPEIIWFKQGVYILTSFSSTLNAQGYSIALQGKDKMCLINGDIGGNLFASHDFGKIYTYHDDDTYEIEDIPIYDIIREAVHVYALEPYSNILINDLDTCAVDLISYRAKNSTLYIYDVCSMEYPDYVKYQQENNGQAPAVIWTSNMAFSGSSLAKFIEANNLQQRIDYPFGYPTPKDFTYKIVKSVGYNDTVGYKLTNLTYAGDLVIAAGGTITQMLDKLVQMLGEFEYFYDLDGRFVFQRKQIYYNHTWTNAITHEGEETYYDTATNTSSNSYEFDRGILVESFQNKPQINNIKNDFSIWGKRKGSSQEIPIHLRYAIDTKPLYYFSYSRHELMLSKTLNKKTGYDWRELLYQMAYDNAIMRGKLDKMMLSVTKELNDTFGNEQHQLTEEEMLIYNYFNAMGHESKQIVDLYEETWNSGYDAYYSDMLGFWPALYRTTRGTNLIYDESGRLEKNDDGTFKFSPNDQDISDDDWTDWKNNGYWNPNYFIYDKESDTVDIIYPELLNFWIDFIDETAEVGQKYGVNTIGRRPKIVNDADVKAISYREVPSILFVSPDDEEVYDDGSISYLRMNIPPSLANYFVRSTQGKSAKDELDNLLYQHTYYQESITLSVVPVYYLQPNTRIRVSDDKSGIEGEYLIKTISIPLQHDGMMSISATKAEDRIL